MCGTKGSVSNDVLRAREESSCPSTEGEENTELPDLFQDPEAWWRRFSPQQRPPSEKQGATPLDLLIKMLQGYGGGAKCPPDYPIRCCTDLISSYLPSNNAPTLYFIKPLDCIAGMFPFSLSACEIPYMPENGLAVHRKRRYTELTMCS